MTTSLRQSIHPVNAKGEEQVHQPCTRQSTGRPDQSMLGCRRPTTWSLPRSVPPSFFPSVVGEGRAPPPQRDLAIESVSHFPQDRMAKARERAGIVEWSCSEAGDRSCNRPKYRWMHPGEANFWTKFPVHSSLSCCTKVMGEAAPAAAGGNARKLCALRACRSGKPGAKGLRP